ncbi:hypothetical protein [Mucilaginibacter lacusdianchii]|uniref:hypothetical protein n=1 Tax=Mucilaginibacter lacusdianchii TaxID=2684211 RepID=UPI00131BD468|nr:hypothetical protein [Mucilaginibacter sp. JXJ CY 39]
MFSLKFAVRYLLHRFKAINRHGLHSPFVYRMVDKVIYDFRDKKVYQDIQNLINPDKRLSRNQKLLYRLVSDIMPQSILLLGRVSMADQRILEQAAPDAIQYLPAEQPVTGKAALLFIDAAKTTGNLWNVFEQCLAYTNTHSSLIIKNLHQRTTNEQVWKAIKAHPQVTVTVDLFWFTLIYFRQGQTREDFLIRF